MERSGKDFLEWSKKRSSLLKKGAHPSLDMGRAGVGTVVGWDVGSAP